jgi:hypothetical protein
MLTSRIRDYGSNHALRVLALASKAMEQANSRLHLEDESGLTFLGLTGMQVTASDRLLLMFSCAGAEALFPPGRRLPLHEPSLLS